MAMSTSSVSGSGSIIDVSGIVNSLIQVEQRPLGAISAKISSANVSISAMSDLKAAVDAAYSSVSALESAQLLSAKTASLSDGSVARVTVTDSSAASLGAVSIAAVKLAEVQRSKLALPGAASPDAQLVPLGSGVLHITIPGASRLVSDDGSGSLFDPGEINIANMTLEEVRDQINESFEGKIRADLVNTGIGSEPWVLVLTGSKTGDSANFDVQYEGSAVAAFQNAQSAEAVVAGITVKSETNKFQDAIPGVELNLLKARTMNGITGSSDVTSLLTVSDNTAEITAKVNTLAGSFTSLIQKIRTLINGQTKRKNVCASCLKAGKAVR